jgi:hypothetical protein
LSVTGIGNSPVWPNQFSFWYAENRRSSSLIRRNADLTRLGGRILRRLPIRRPAYITSLV